MEVRWEESSDGLQSHGFRYYFVDYVIKGYSGQDHIQVGAVDKKIKALLKENNPSAKKISI